MSDKLNNNGLLMPKATAVWLVENTALTFEQIGDFTGLHAIEVQALADEEVGRGIVGRNPVENGELKQTELDKASEDQNYLMKRATTDLPPVKVRSKGPRYTPVSKRGDKPDAIAYLIKHHPEITDAQIKNLIGTTKPTIDAIRDRSHRNIQAIKPRHPVDLGLCSYSELDAASRKGFKAQGKDPDEIKEQQMQALEDRNQDNEKAEDPMSGFDFSNFLGKGNI